MKGKSKYNKGIASFICEKVAEGWTISRLCKEHRGELVSEKTIYDWRVKHEDFKHDLAQAYQTHIYKQMDELKDLSEELLNLDDEIQTKLKKAEGDPDALKDALSQAKLHSAIMRDRRDNIRVRIDAIKFSLSNLAPKLVPELKEQAKVQVGVVMPSISIINYRDATDDTKLIEGQ